MTDPPPPEQPAELTANAWIRNVQIRSTPASKTRSDFNDPPQPGSRYSRQVQHPVRR